MESSGSKIGNNKLGQSSKLGKSQQIETDYVSYDAPPLDFSYKNIVNLECKIFI